MGEPTDVSRFLGCEHCTGTQTIWRHGIANTSIVENIVKLKQGPHGGQRRDQHNRGAACGGTSEVAAEARGARRSGSH